VVTAAGGAERAQAYVQALTGNPRLYQRYLEQHPQQNGAR
jgi:hypothetical protein